MSRHRASKRGLVLVGKRHQPTLTKLIEFLNEHPKYRSALEDGSWTSIVTEMSEKSGIDKTKLRACLNRMLDLSREIERNPELLRNTNP